MKSYLDKIFILEGILLAIIGVLFFINPVNAFFNFTTICGILIIIAGILRIIRAFGTDSKMYYILTGIIDILFGFIIWFKMCIRDSTNGGNNTTYKIYSR